MNSLAQIEEQEGKLYRIPGTPPMSDVYGEPVLPDIGGWTLTGMGQGSGGAVVGPWGVNITYGGGAKNVPDDFRYEQTLVACQNLYPDSARATACAAQTYELETKVINGEITPEQAAKVKRREEPPAPVYPGKPPGFPAPDGPLFKIPRWALVPLGISAALLAVLALRPPGRV